MAWHISRIKYFKYSYERYYSLIENITIVFTCCTFDIRNKHTNHLKHRNHESN